MLKIKNKKKVAISVAVASAVIVPSTIFAVNKLNTVEGTFAASVPSGFADQNFYDCVLAEFQEEFPDETVSSNGLTDAQLAKIETLYCAGDDVADNEKITNTTGVEKMTSLTSLIIRSQKLSTIDLGTLSALNFLDVDDNELSGIINISSNTSLKSLLVHKNKLSGINFGSVTGLENLDISNNEISGVLDLNNNPGLVTLSLNNNSVSELKFNSMTDLKILSINSNNISGVLDVSKNTSLETLEANDNNLTGVELGTINTLKSVSLSNNQLTGTIDISNNPRMVGVYLDNNKLTGVKLDNSNAIVRLELSDNLLSGTLDMRNRTNLSILGIYNNNLTELLVDNSPNLKNLYADNIVITTGIEKDGENTGRIQFDLSGLKFISEDGNTTINNTSNYTFDITSKLLDVNDIAYAKGYVTTSPIDTSKRLSEYKTYKLRIGEIGEDDSDDPGEDETDDDEKGEDEDDGSEESDDNSTSEEEEEDVAVPSTSGGTKLGGKMDTGALTKEDSDNSSAGFSILPIVVVTLAAAGVIGRKFIARKRINW